MSQSTFRTYLGNFLYLAIAAYIILLGIYFYTGGFDFTAPLIGRVYLDHWLRPYQIILAAALLLMAMSAFPQGAGKPLAEASTMAVEWLAERWLAVVIAIIFLLAVALRLWAIAHGIPEDVYWIDAPQFMRAAQEYLNGNYALETGYPYFSSHFVEWTFRGINLLLLLAGAEPLRPEFPVLAMIGRGLNLFFTAGIMAAVYRIAAIAGYREAGLLGMLLVAVSTINIQMSHYFINDFPMAFFSLLSVWAAVKNLEEERLRWYLLAGAMASLSFACKYNGVLSFIFLGLVYLHLHRDMKSFRANLDKPVKAVLIFALVYAAITPSLWVDPAGKFLMHKRMARILADPRNMILAEPTGLKLIDHATLLFTEWKYHLFVMQGLFHPLPLLIALPAFAYMAYRRRWRMLFLWGGVLAAFFIGKVSKPNSATYHFLNVSPLALLAAAIGIMDALALVKNRVVGAAVITLLSLVLVNQALQDASYWTLPPAHHAVESWKKQNIAQSDEAVSFLELDREAGQARDRIFQEFHTGAPGKAFSVLRDLFHYVSLKDGRPSLFPMGHVGARNKESVIYPSSNDMVTTEKVFATGRDTGLMKARRFVRTGGAAKEVIVWVKNAQPEENKLTLSIGRMRKEFTLPKGGMAFLAAYVDGNRTYLYNGGYVEVAAESSLDAVWMIGANHQDIAQMYESSGQVLLALENHGLSASAHSLMRIMALSERLVNRMKAFEELEKKYPALFKAMTTLPPDQIDWKTVAGYGEELFASKADMVLDLKGFNRTGMPQGDTVIPPGGSMYGPYLALTRGDYLLELKWMTRDDAPVSFAVELRTNRSDLAITQRKIDGEEAKAGRLSIPFVVRNSHDYPLELVITDVEGGPLAVEEVRLKIDYMTSMRNVIRQAMDGLKKKKI